MSTKEKSKKGGSATAEAEKPEPICTFEGSKRRLPIDRIVAIKTDLVKRALGKNQMGLKEMAEKHDVTVATVSAINNRRTHNDVKVEVDGKTYK